jgi:hypothetical protein
MAFMSRFNVCTDSDIPRIAALLTSAGKEEQGDHDRACAERDPQDDLEERRHS